MEEDYYALLEIQRTASSSEIKVAYRKKIRKYHPDLSKKSDAEMLAKRINQAYAVLSDPLKRQHYDLQLPFIATQPTTRPSAHTVWQTVATPTDIPFHRTRQGGSYRVRVKTRNGYFDIEFR